MGLTAEDVEALQSMEEIEQAEGVYSEVVQVTLENADGLESQVHQNKTAQVKTLSSGNLNHISLRDACLKRWMKLLSPRITLPSRERK